MAINRFGSNLVPHPVQAFTVNTADFPSGFIELLTSENDIFLVPVCLLVHKLMLI